MLLLLYSVKKHRYLYTYFCVLRYTKIKSLYPLYLYGKIEINTFASAEKKRIFNSLFFSSILEILVFQIKTYFGIFLA